MRRLYVFADEAGDFAFKRHESASQYYIVCTVAMEDCQVAADLLELRRELIWNGSPVRDYFHCTNERQETRDRVFATILERDFTVQATILEKSKAQPQLRTSDQRFYQYAWLYHLRYAIGRHLQPEDEIQITAATIGTKKIRTAFEDSVRDVCRQTIKSRQFKTAFCPCSHDPCLQVADYCTWAIQRKFERGDDRSFELIKDRITYQYNLFGRGTTHYY